MQATTVRTNPQIRTLTTLAVSLLAVSGLAQANYFCVATAQQFQNALTQSSDGGLYNGEDNQIYMVGATYKTGAATNNAPFFFYSSNSAHAIDIAGGYGAGCSARTTQTPPTTLDGVGNTGVLTVRNKYGNILVRNLTLQNGESAEPGAGLQVNYLTSVNGSVDIDDNIIRNNHSTASAGGLYASAGGYDLYLLANLITGNSADGAYGAGYVTGYGLSNQLVNNTVTQNTSAAATNPTGGMYCGGGTPCHIYNNIFWNNTTYGIFLGSSGAVLSHNDYGTQGGAAPAVDDNNLSTSPKFVDANGGDFHLAGDSPLLGFGVPFGSIFDLDGNQFPFSGKIDLGAYAETIFIDGFDGG